MIKIWNAANDYGWLLALAVAVIAVAAVYLKAPQAVPLVGIPAPTEVKIVPATGVDGFPVATFCEDKASRVLKVETQPDSTILTYTLERVRDNRQELVIWKDSGRGAEHWYFDAAGAQQYEPAVVSDAARKCIEGKPK